LADNTTGFSSSFIFGTATSGDQSMGVAMGSDWSIREKSGQNPPSGKGNDKINRFDEDFLRLAELGLNHYRTSLDWTRIEPEKGMYDRQAVEDVRIMLDSAKRRGITVWLTLHHVNQPHWFSRMGGFTDSKAFSYWHKFVEMIARELGKDAPYWIPVHEPTTYAAGAFLVGQYTPGKKRLDKFSEMMVKVHEAHGDAYRILKAYLPSSAKVGVVAEIAPFHPLDVEANTDVTAADFFNRHINLTTITAIKDGMVSMPGHKAIEIPSCKGAADFFGIDYFQRLVTGVGAPVKESFYTGLADLEGMPPVTARMEDDPLAENGVGACPEGIGEAIKTVYSQGLELPIYITGSGIATSDEDLRKWYVTRCLQETADLANRGLNVKGYMHWTDVDTYDWTNGYNAHYGLFGFDRQTYDRIERPAAELLSRVAKTSEIPELEPETSETGT